MEKKGITLETIEHILGKKIPWIFKCPLKRLLHLEEINAFLSYHGDETGMQFLNSALKFLDIEIKIIGNLEIDKNSRCCIVCNHPLGGIDGVSVLKAIGDACDGNVKVIVNSFLATVPGLREFVVPIKMVNTNSDSSQKMRNAIHELFEGDSNVLMFPAQICSRKQQGKVQDKPWKTTFLKMSMKYNRHIVPIYFHGKNSETFYKIANFCSFLSTLLKKPELEKVPMVLLVNEMFKNKGKSFSIVIGESISGQELLEIYDKKGGNYYLAAQEIRKRIYKLGESLP